MKYKTKHLKHLLPVAAVATMTFVNLSCQPENSVTKKDKTEQGLLAQKDFKTTDKYGTEIFLQKTDIPIYRTNGQRMENCFVVTFGQNPELFADYHVENLSLQRAYLNENPEATCLMTGKYNEVVDENGRFVGLVVNDNGHVVAIAPQNMKAYVEEFNRSLTPNTPQLIRKNTNKIDTLQNSIPVDSIHSMEKNDSVPTDSLVLKVSKVSQTIKQSITDSISASIHERG